MKITIDVLERDAQKFANEVNAFTAKDHKRTAKEVATEFVQQLVDERFSLEFFDAENFVEYPIQWNGA